MEIKSYGELRELREDKITQMHETFGLFWAFSDKQYEESKKEDEVYVSVGMGGYLPESKAEGFINEMEALNKWFNDEVMNFKKQAIAFELANHECYYTGEIDVVVAIFSGIFSKFEIVEVYLEERQNNEW